MQNLFLITMLIFATSACSSSPDRAPSSAQTNRAGRPVQPAKVINRYPLDTNSLFNACIKERSDSYCRNRLGR